VSKANLNDITTGMCAIAFATLRLIQRQVQTERRLSDRLLDGQNSSFGGREPPGDLSDSSQKAPMRIVRSLLLWMRTDQSGLK
jgi:hypothetical protein